jgi:predicted esterase
VKDRIMDKRQIKFFLEKLNDELRWMSVKGEVCLYGGAVMCLVYDARPATKDVDAVFKPTHQMREAIKRVAQANGLKEDWLNDAVKVLSFSIRKRLF